MVSELGRVGIDAAIGGAFVAIGGGISGEGSRCDGCPGPHQSCWRSRASCNQRMVEGCAGIRDQGERKCNSEVAAGFVGGFENLAHDAVNGKIGDKGPYSIREHVVSTVSGGIFGGLSSAPRALSGSLAKSAQPMTPKMYDTARSVKIIILLLVLPS